jgi:hypothetical protein
MLGCVPQFWVGGDPWKRFGASRRKNFDTPSLKGLTFASDG